MNKLKLSYEEIIEVIKKEVTNPFDLIYSPQRDSEGNVEFATLGHYHLALCDDSADCTDEEVNYVLHFTEHDVFVKINGYYISHMGIDFHDNCYSEVRPYYDNNTIEYVETDPTW